MRNKVIDTATELIKTNKIDFNAFLKRVVFDKTKVSAGMLAFEHVDPIDENDIYNQLDYVHGATEEVNNNSGPSNDRVCAVCKSTYPTVTLLPCRHQCVCIDCYRTWNRVDKSMLDVLPEVDNYNEVEIFNRQDSREPYKDTICPLCKTPVKDFVESILL